MASEWRQMKLGDVVNLKRGFDLPAKERKAGAIPIITSSGVSDYHSEAKVKGPGVVTGRYGTIGSVYFCETDFWPHNTTLYVEDFKGNDPRFVYYLLHTISYTNYTDKAAVPGVNRNHLHTADVRVPDVKTQRELAEMLVGLDDKIELNRRMNATLEQMAQSLFKSWFVDFDPVKAKADGRAPEGMDAETAAFFPSEFEESELGPIPKGWKVGALEDFLVLQRGFDLPSANRVPGPFPVLAASGPSGTHNKYKVKGPGITTGRSGVLGNVFFVHEDFWPLNTSLWVKEFKVSTPVHAYHLLKNIDVSTFNAGSAVPTLNRNHVHGLKMVVPIREVILYFEEAVAPVFCRIHRNEKESQTLTGIRSDLLPRLISGQLRIPNIEQAEGGV